MTTGLFAQPRPYVVKFKEPTANRNTLPFNLVAINDLRGGNGTIGIVHTGLMNKPRTAVLKPDFEAGLHFMCKPTIGQFDDNTPTAELNILVFRIGETIFAMDERRTTDIAATLTVHTPRGPQHYGPAQFSLSKSVLDATKGHARAITEALEQITAELAADYRASQTISDRRPDYNLLPPGDEIGAYNTLLDFHLGNVDTTNQPLILQKMWRLKSQYKEHEFHQGRFHHKDGTTRKDLMQLFGYRYRGRDFLHIKGKFYEVRRMPDGSVLALLPRNLQTVMTNQQMWGYAIGGLLGHAIATSVNNPNQLIPYEFDVRSGLFRPMKVSASPVEVDGKR